MGIIDKQVDSAMIMVGRAGLWLAAAAFCVIFPNTGSYSAPPEPIFQSMTDNSADFSRTVAELEDWLDRKSPYPRRSNPAPIRFIDPAHVARLPGHHIRPSPHQRGFYDIELGVIYIVRPWSQDNPKDVSVVLHELVHHRQQTAKHWYCPGAQELPAYRLQEKWLAERGLVVPINWVAAVLEAGCTRRDMHPD